MSWSEDIYEVARLFGYRPIEKEIQRVQSGLASSVEKKELADRLRQAMNSSRPGVLGLNTVVDSAAKEVKEYHTKMKEYFVSLFVAQPDALTDNNLNKPPQHPKGYDGRNKNSA